MTKCNCKIFPPRWQCVWNRTPSHWAVGVVIPFLYPEQQSSGDVPTCLMQGSQVVHSDQGVHLQSISGGSASLVILLGLDGTNTQKHTQTHRHRHADTHTYTTDTHRHILRDVYFGCPGGSPDKGCQIDSRPCQMTLCPWARRFTLLASGGISPYLL